MYVRTYVHVQILRYYMGVTEFFLLDCNSLESAGDRLQERYRWSQRSQAACGTLLRPLMKILALPAFLCTGRELERKVPIEETFHMWMSFCHVSAAQIRKGVHCENGGFVSLQARGIQKVQYIATDNHLEHLRDFFFEYTGSYAEENPKVPSQNIPRHYNIHIIYKYLLTSLYFYEHKVNNHLQRPPHLEHARCMLL